MMIWDQISVPVPGMTVWGAMHESGISFVVSHDATQEFGVYRASYKLNDADRAKPFVMLESQIGEGFSSLEGAVAACEMALPRLLV